jgi:hypothetical protein
MSTTATITTALRIALSREDYCVLDGEEVAHLLHCLSAGTFDKDGKDFALCVLEDAEDDIGYDATIALGSVGSIRPI